MALLRFRRYRVFVFGAAAFLFLLYQLSQSSQLNDSTQKIIYKGYSPPAEPGSVGNSGGASDGKSEGGSLGDGIASTSPKDVVQDAENAAPQEPVRAPELPSSLSVKGASSLPTENSAPEPSTPQQTDASVPVSAPAPVDENGIADTERVHRVNPPAAFQETVLPQQPATAAPNRPVPTTSIIHWKKMPEHFPIPEESLIPLPTGSPKVIPRIQHRFEDETIAQREVRESRLDAVRREMQHAWSGYRQFAWTHDELGPVSQTFRDPFCGWAASMVDALDTLWIMGMFEEFDEAYAAVKEIDFTTTPYRSEIPVFETIIRYLGGLIAAYDVSGGASGNYPALLTKATELAEILMGVFDTPNRMPILYYNWKPAFSSQPAAASSSSSIAEIGSMTMEFTRLAQLTGNNKYYDAIARIVDAIEEWQSRPGGTALPGIFPEQVDASGCNRTAAALQKARLANEKLASDLAKAQIEAAADSDAKTEPVGYQPSQADPDPMDAADQVKAKATDESEPGLEFRVSPASSPEEGEFVNVYHKRDVGDVSESQAAPAAQAEAVAAAPVAAPATPPVVPVAKPPVAASHAPIKADGTNADFQCIPMNLTAGGYGRDSFSMGGSQDSTYEYFPKQFLLLGGLVEKYQTMHEKVADAVLKYLLYRPMIEDSGREILFSAKVMAKDGNDENLSYHYELTHLTCFLGGMFAMGGRIFDRPDDVHIGSMLADGCAWAYEVMPTGIMPEGATMLPCEDSTDCAWNQTVWHGMLDSNRAYRDEQMLQYDKKMQQWEVDKNEVRRKQEERVARKQREKAAADAARKEAEANPVAGSSAPSTDNVAKRDIGNTGALAPPPPAAAKVDAQEAATDAAEKTADNDDDDDDVAKAAAAKKLEQAAEETSSTRVIAPGSGFRNRNKGGSAKPASQTQLDGDGDDDDDKALVTPPMPRKPESHEEYVKSRIERDNLQPGFMTINDRRYILRPEAIESVWYMYRITGDPSWQAKGWRMFEAVIRATRTDAGHSAIGDVTRRPQTPSEGADSTPAKMDNMESFWLAETLKYFYLLFTPPDVISLDEYVLNTEAHPFKRPV
ncbi:glycoside hydrolase family 47 protein [Ophiostoma piceae UAMH 11346]|uniref:alpha-1,2-Mannosidase n=1 Tax=Ophiostoma piceae (strain UAMH 11346) TaxID=1262450 RepID=S3BPU7_OPHP1|nr:glycoside hydrolase family 47 protein [Ophiostoma piceae UAMH 11346]